MLIERKAEFYSVSIDNTVDDAMVAIKCDNPRLKGVSPKGKANFVWVQRFILYRAPQTALRGSAFLQDEDSLQVGSEAKDNMAAFVLANGGISIMLRL